MDGVLVRRNCVDPGDERGHRSRSRLSRPRRLTSDVGGISRVRGRGLTHGATIMKELFERHRDHLTPEEDQAIWGRVEQKLTVERSFWKSWRLPMSIAATASAALVALVLTRGSHELATVNVKSIETQPLPPRMTVVPAPSPERQVRGAETKALPETDKEVKKQEGKGAETSQVREVQALKMDLPDVAPGQPAEVAADQDKSIDSFDQAMKRKEAQEGTIVQMDALQSTTVPPTPSAGAAPQTSTVAQGLRAAPSKDQNVERRSYAMTYSPPAPVEKSPSALRKDESGAPNSVGGTTPVNGQAFDAMFFQHYGVNPFIDPED